MTLSTTPDKRRGRRTRAQIEQLREQITAVLKHDHPQSVRHVFYRMTDPRLAYQAAEYINEATESGFLPADIFYIGDYDPAGVLIDRSIEAELRKHIDPDVDLNFHRIAITSEQIGMYDLPTKPRKKTDTRARHITETVEAEAMPAHILRRLLRDHVESFPPADAFRIAKVAEEHEKHRLLDLAERMEDGGIA